MSTSVPTTPHVSIEERLDRLENMRTTVGFPGPAQPQVRPHTWTNVVQIGTLIALLSFAFWLGSLSTKVSMQSDKLDKLNESVAGASRDSISSRSSVIETKIDALAAKPQQPRPLVSK